MPKYPHYEHRIKGREVFLVYDEDIGAALQFAVENSDDSNAVHLAKAAQIVRKDMLEKKQNLDGTFTSSCQKDSVPTSLLALVTMMLEGPNIQDQTDLETIESDIALTISQLLLFNTVNYCLTKISIRAKRSISRVFSLFIVPSPFFCTLPVQRPY